MPQKTVKFVVVVPKTVGSTTFCAYRNAIMLATYNNFFLGGAFYGL